MNNYYPQPYANTYLTNYSNNYANNSVNGINWCQGEVGAKSFPVAPGNTVPIFDSEDSCVYIKSVDVMGRPLPLKILDYHERTDAPKEVIVENNYIEKDTFNETMSSFNEKLDEVIALLMKSVKETKKEKADAK